MKAEKLGPAAIASFKHCFTELVSGKTGMITESDIKPAKNIPSLEDNIKNKYEFDSSLLNKVVQIKLNGGLGTSMGLNQAKSLLNIKDSDTFLDLTACQIQSFRQKFNSDLKFMLLNSFNTSEDTINFLSKKYEWMNKKKTSDNSSESFIELIQNKVPKVYIYIYFYFISFTFSKFFFSRLTNQILLQLIGQLIRILNGVHQVMVIFILLFMNLDNLKNLFLKVLSMLLFLILIILVLL